MMRTMGEERENKRDGDRNKRRTGGRGHGGYKSTVERYLER